MTWKRSKRSQLVFIQEQAGQLRELLQLDDFFDFILRQVEKLSDVTNNNTYLQVLQRLGIVLKEGDVLNRVGWRVDAQQELKVNDFFDVSDVVLAQIQILQVHIRSQMFS